MSLSPNIEASDNEASDWFSAFDESDDDNKPELSASWKSSISSECDTAACVGSVGTCEEYSIETGLKVLPGIPKPKSADQKSECSSDSTVFNGVSTKEPLPMCSGKVSELASKQMPSEDLSNLKDLVISDPQKEDKTLVASQQPVQIKRSPMRSFLEGLSEYFKKDFTKKTANKEDNRILQPMVEPANTIIASAKPVLLSPFKMPVQAAPPMVEPANPMPLSPFKMPVQAAPPMVEPAKVSISAAPPKAISMPSRFRNPMVVAGLDLTGLVEYKNPKHLHRRKDGHKPAKPVNVPPFKKVPVQAAPPKEISMPNESKKPIMEPAGFDLTHLVECKNPKHFHRRKDGHEPAKPFKKMPVQAAPPMVEPAKVSISAAPPKEISMASGSKNPMVVAGLDLTGLVEYKKPKHFHRRKDGHKPAKKVPVQAAPPKENTMSNGSKKPIMGPAFKKVPVQAAPPKEISIPNGSKEPTVVPASADSTGLVEHKNPKHFHRRQDVRKGDKFKS